MLDNYEINTSTLLIIPINKTTSKVVEKENTYIVNKKSTEIIDNSCRYFGSSLIGRLEGTKNLIGVNYKCPIVIEDALDIIFFPTSSPRFNNCFWISLNNIKDYQKNQKTCKLIFKNDFMINLNISYESLQNQIYRATLLESTLRKRKYN